MQQSDEKKKLKTKNYAVLAALVVFMVIVFAVTMIRLKMGLEASGYGGE